MIFIFTTIICAIGWSMEISYRKEMKKNLENIIKDKKELIDILINENIND